MSRIATLTAVLTMLVAPAAFAGQDLRSPDTRDVVARTAVTKIDLRSPDARDVFVSPASTLQAAPDGGGSVWIIIGLIAAAIAACTALAVMLRRHLQVGRPVGV